MRTKGLLKILFTLLFVTSFAFFMTGCPWDDEDDELDCANAGRNAEEILWSKFSGNQAGICTDLYDTFDIDYDDYQDCLDIDAGDWDQDYAIAEMRAWCEEEWTESDVNCVKAAEDYTDLVACHND